jgi:hypothetical protein
MGLVASFVTMAVVSFLTRGAAVGTLSVHESRPWSALTYPWALDSLGSPMALVLLLLLGIWLVQFGGSVERDMGTGRFATFWVVATLLFGIVAMALGLPLAGPMLPGAAVIVVWGARNPRSSVLLYGVLPISGTWLAGLTVAAVFLSFGAMVPVAGALFAAILGVAWSFGQDRLPLAYSGTRRAKAAKVTVVRGATAYDESYFENVKQREIEREERERLRKLFEGE